MLTRKQHDLLVLIHERLQEDGIPPSFEEMKVALDLKSKSGIHRLITALEERGFIRRLPNRARALEVIKLPEGYNVGNAATSPAGQLSGGFNPSVIEGGAGSATSTPETGSNVAQFPGSNTTGRGGLAARYGHQESSSVGGFSESAAPISAAPLNAANDVSEVPVMGKIAAGVPIAAIQDPSGMMAVPPSMLGMGRHYALEVQGDSMIEAGILDGDTVIIQETNSADLGDIVVALVDDEEATLKTFRKQDGKIALEAANPAYETRVLDASRVKVQGKLAGLVREY